jgi:hypothetical protein
VALILAYVLGIAVLQVGYQSGGALTAAGLATLPANALPIVAAATVLGVRPEEVVQAGDGCLSPEGLVSAVMVVVVEPGVRGGGALCA